MRIVTTTVKVTLFLVLTTGCIATIASPLEAQPVQWSVNGHWYEARYRPGGIDWETAENECVADGGYLATILSAEENSFVYSLISDNPAFWPNGPWIGGFQPPGSPEPNGGWQWVTGEAWGFTNWGPGEPNDGIGEEHHLHYWHRDQVPSDTWNDRRGYLDLEGYIFEKGGPAQWSVNGHWYEARLRPGGIDWCSAVVECAADGGYLATITSAEENSFVYSLISDDPAFWPGGPWIGGFQPDGSSEPDGGWRWITDEAWSFTNWCPGEPSNGDVGWPNAEQYLYYWHRDLPASDTWNDRPELSELPSYILERGGADMEIGACCAPSGMSACIMTDRLSCEAQGGIYLGDGTLCGPGICATPATRTTWGHIKALYQ